MLTQDDLIFKLAIVIRWNAYSEILFRNQFLN